MVSVSIVFDFFISTLLNKAVIMTTILLLSPKVVKTDTLIWNTKILAHFLYRLVH